MENTIVCKFGGTSVASADMFRRVRSIVYADKRRKYIVVSAPGICEGRKEKVTDLLIRAHSSKGNERDEFLMRAAGVFRDIARELELPDIESDLRAALDCPDDRDTLVSRGEWLCARLMARWLGFRFIDAADAVRFSGDEVDARATEALMAGLPPCCVIPGFYGADHGGHVRTFSRGGSDITGALLASALRAELYENWTDVDGFRTADPAYVPESMPIAYMDYHQAELLASAGASVLHGDSIAPCRMRNIPIAVKNTFSPDLPGTVISAAASCVRACVTSRSVGDGKYSICVYSPDIDDIKRASCALPAGCVSEISANVLRFIWYGSDPSDICRAIHSVCSFGASRSSNSV